MEMFYDGFDVSDIADDVGLKPSTVKRVIKQKTGPRRKRKIYKPRYPVAEVIREHVLKVLALNNDNRTHAARDLGISLRTLRNKLREYGVKPKGKK